MNQVTIIVILLIICNKINKRTQKAGHDKTNMQYWIKEMIRTLTC